jgi:2-amino-4-hydroxy-6-hydroxymethyldihydropteridine diphosphokinase
MLSPVGIALGSNLGERTDLIQQTLAWLRGLSDPTHFLASRVVESEPVDCPPDSPKFLNAVVEIHWPHNLRKLLGILQRREREAGRPEVRPVNAPRPLDLDLLYAGQQIIAEPDLILPHPRAHLRGFVLGPLAEIRPALILPGQTKTVQELWDELR